MGVRRACAAWWGVGGQGDRAGGGGVSLRSWQVQSRCHGGEARVFNTRQSAPTAELQGHEGRRCWKGGRGSAGDRSEHQATGWLKGATAGLETGRKCMV